MKKQLYRYTYYLLAASIISFTILMITKIVPYLGFEHAFRFLGIKRDAVLAQTWYMWAFYVHILSSSFSIGLGILGFSADVIKCFPTLHRNMGKVYVMSILVLAAPSGLLIALEANGGLTCKVAFVLQSITWWLLTFWALLAIKRSQWKLHINMMLRSYAVTLAAMSLRTESYILHYFFDCKPMESYQTVTWLSWVGNLLLIELCIHYGLGKRLLHNIKGSEGIYP